MGLFICQKFDLEQKKKIPKHFTGILFCLSPSKVIYFKYYYVCAFWFNPMFASLQIQHLSLDLAIKHFKPFYLNTLLQWGHLQIKFNKVFFILLSYEVLYM